MVGLLLTVLVGILLSLNTDARNVLASIAKTMPALAGIVAKCDSSIKSPTWNDKKITAHHGIIPTQQAADGSKFSEEEWKIYRLIAERYIANFLPSPEYLACSIELRIANERFSAKGRLVTKLGWEAAAGVGDEEKTDDEGQALPELKAGLQLPVSGVDCKEERTKPPAAFTEGTLIRAMETFTWRLTTLKARSSSRKETVSAHPPRGLRSSPNSSGKSTWKPGAKRSLQLSLAITCSRWFRTS